MTYDYAADDAAAPGSGDNILKAIAALALEQLAAEEDVERSQQNLELSKAALENIKNRRFPELMQEAGQKLIKTENNLIVELKDVVRASIPEVRRPEAHAVLAEQGHGDVIKFELKAELGKGDDARNKAVLIQEYCNTLGVAANCKEAVHPSTLAALMKELIAAGVEFDHQLFGVFVSKETKIKVAK